MQKSFLIILLFICSVEFSCQQNSIQPTTKTLVRVEKTYLYRNSGEFDTAYTTYLIQPAAFLDSIRNIPNYNTGELTNVVLNTDDSLVVVNNDSECYNLFYKKANYLSFHTQNCMGMQYSVSSYASSGFFKQGNIDSIYHEHTVSCTMDDCHDNYFNHIKFVYQNKLLLQLKINFFQSSIYYGDAAVNYTNEITYPNNYTNQKGTLGFDVNDILLNICNFDEAFIFNGLISYHTNSKNLIENCSLFKLSSVFDARKEITYQFDSAGTLESFTINEYHNNVLEFISVYRLIYAE